MSSLGTNSVCSRTHQVAKLIGNWEDIAQELGLTDPEIKAIQKDGHDEPERRKMMLNEWIQKNGSDATFHVLIEACRAVGEEAVAQEIASHASTGRLLCMIQ